MIEEKCKRCGERVGLVSLVTSSILGCFKLLIGIKTGSHALMANAFYSIQDVISAGFVHMGMKYSKRDIDERFPYGYGKIEFIISVAVSVGIIIGVCIISFFAGRSVLAGPKNPGMLAFWCALVSIFTTFFLSRYVKCAGITLNSPAIISSAQHIHADLISSACVAAGIIFTKLGFHHLDPMIAIFEAIHIIITSIKIFDRGVKGLMDASLPDKEIKKIKKVLENVEGIREVILLRTRQLGQKKQIDCEVEIDGDEKLDRADKIKKRIKSSIFKAMEQEYLVNISVAPAKSHILKEKQKTAGVIEILQKYYRHFVDRHKLSVRDKRIDLSLVLLPEVNDSKGKKFCSSLQKKIKKEFPDDKVTVTPIED